MKAAEALLGYSKSEIVGKSNKDIFPKDQADKSTSESLKALREKQPSEVLEGPIATRNKGARWLRTRRIPILDSNGTPVYLMGISEDLTQAKMAEDQKILLSLEHQARINAEKNLKHMSFLTEFLTNSDLIINSSSDYNSMLRSLSKMIVPTVADVCIIHLVKELTGKTDSSVSSSTPVCIVFHSHKFDNEYAMLDQIPHQFKKSQILESQLGLLEVLKSGKSVIKNMTTDRLRNFSSNILMNLKDKEQLKFLKDLNLKSIICAPMKAKNRILGVLTLATGDSDRVYGKADVAMAEELATRAAVSIDNSKLFLESKRVHKIKDELLTSVSHELRTALNVIMGYAEVLRTQNLNEKFSENLNGNLTSAEVREAIEAIYRNSKIQNRIVGELVRLSSHSDHSAN